MRPTEMKDQSMTTTTDIRGPWAEGGHQIAQLRLAREITQAELAEQAGLPNAGWLSDIEVGRRPVPSAFYQAMALQLGMTASDFAALCLRHYDPKAYEALFGVEAPALKLAA
ncbi:MAG TPA: XRE family transcriptional regulator [Rhodospirillaceae bacterium]|nr:transcriptional regulator [Rhodospirillaceae bacterium]MBB57701.1 transcriptional regulator [Rhodospirillaceae bacterium]HAE01850.1 XRE family transcriptional regulator [Rhodospirillaceae bacterium]HBM11472.1 XRE family transcriptional regulator [Rhodospirillaceae bacterium]